MTSQGGGGGEDIYNGTIMIYVTKTILCTIRAIYYAKTT